MKLNVFKALHNDRNGMMQAFDELNRRAISSDSLKHTALLNYTSRTLPALGLHLYILFLIKLKLLKPNYVLALFYIKQYAESKSKIKPLQRNVTEIT